ncbi:MAG: DNA-protecting protein DprA, partial [Pseudomonadota bacterium]
MGALSDAERLDWLRLARADGVGPITFAKLVARFGTAGDALTALPDLAARAGRRKPLRAPSRAAAQREIEAAAAVGARV